MPQQSRNKLKFFFACYGPFLKSAHIYVPYVHNPESARKILQIQLKKGYGCLGKLTIETLDMSMIKKMAADLKTKGKKPVSTCGLLG